MNDDTRRPDRELLDRWLAGDASDDELGRLEAAAGADPTLAGELEAHRRAIAAVRGLAPEREPERDLWPAIAPRLARSRRPSWPLALAAALALVAAGLSLTTRWLDRPAPPVLTADDRPAPPAAPQLAAYAATERDLAAVADELRRSIEARRDALPPETRRLVFENLATIERALADIEAALAEQPADPLLARTYVEYRQREVALLRRANRIAARL